MRSRTGEGVPPDAESLLRSVVCDELSGCHLWLGRLSVHGYALVSIAGRDQRVHRVAWELRYGLLSSGVKVLHRCDRRACVNPDHLFVGTQLTNVADQVDKGRTCRGERNAWVKLTPSEALAVRDSVGRVKDVALRFGISNGQVSKIRRGQKWAVLG